MSVLWGRTGEVSAREVTDELGGYALSTISTVLDRLSRKGLVLRQQEGRSVRFSPITSRSEHTVALMREVLAASPEPDQAIVEFVRSASPKERRAMRRVLAAGHKGVRS